MKLLWLLPLIFTFFNENSLTEKGKLTLQIDNIEQSGGMIWIGVYDSQSSFLIQEKAVLVQGENVNAAGEMIMQLKEIPYGTYAIAIFHDENNSGQMDQNWIGIPLEPYSFSVPYASKWRVPKFEDVKFDFTRPNQVVKTNLARW